jgi:hypothetical protein
MSNNYQNKYENCFRCGYVRNKVKIDYNGKTIVACSDCADKVRDYLKKREHDRKFYTNDASGIAEDWVVKM